MIRNQFWSIKSAENLFIAKFSMKTLNWVNEWPGLTNDLFNESANWARFVISKSLISLNFLSISGDLNTLSLKVWGKYARRMPTNAVHAKFGIQILDAFIRLECVERLNLLLAFQTWTNLNLKSWRPSIESGHKSCVQSYRTSWTFWIQTSGQFWYKIKSV